VRFGFSKDGLGIYEYDHPEGMWFHNWDSKNPSFWKLLSARRG
jgi:hypothetical protein